MYDTYSEPRKSFFILLIAIAAYAAAILTTSHYVRMTGDSTLYLSIAEKYLIGDFANAINGYWGPLLSWILVPFLYLGASHIFAINAVNMLFGILAMTGFWLLSYRFDLTEMIRSFLFIPLLAILLFYSLIEPMDFLLLTVLIYYLFVVFNSEYPEKMWYGFACGFLGALGYFSKPYGFPFFIAHFILMNIFHYFRTKSRQSRKSIVRNCIAGLVVFFLLSGIWVSLISVKYGHLTFSNMGKGVFSGLGPGSKHETLEKGDPIFFDGFFEPPNETAIVIYEDPSHARHAPWNPLESWGLFKYFVSNVTKNVFEGIRVYESFSRLSLSIIIAYLLFLFIKPFQTVKVRYEIMFPFMTIMLYTGGYMPFHFEARYLWIVNILLLLMGGYVLNELFQRDFFKSRIKKTVLLVLFIFSFLVSPLENYIQIDAYSMNRDMYSLSEKLKERYAITGDIASNREIRTYVSHDSWHKTFRLSYWLNGRYFGQPREDISDDDLKSELEKHDIDFYFFWGDAAQAPSFLTEYKEVTGGTMPDLTVYSLKEKILSPQLEHKQIEIH